MSWIATRFAQCPWFSVNEQGMCLWEWMKDWVMKEGERFGSIQIIWVTWVWRWGLFILIPYTKYTSGSFFKCQSLPLPLISRITIKLLCSGWVIFIRRQLEIMLNFWHTYASAFYYDVNQQLNLRNDMMLSKILSWKSTAVLFWKTWQNNITCHRCFTQYNHTIKIHHNVETSLITI